MSVPADAPDAGRRERQFIDAVTAVIALVVAVESVAWLALGERWLPWGVATLLVLLVPVRLARRLAARGEAGRAARLTGAGLMAAALAYALIVPPISGALAAVPLMVVALLLPHRRRDRRGRRATLLGAWLFSVAIAVAGELARGRDLGLHGPSAFLDAFAVLALVLIYTLTLLLIAQYDSRLREHLDRLAESEARLQAVVETAADAVLVVDGDGRVTRSNRAAAAVFGQPSSGLAGRALDHLLDTPLDALAPTGSLGGHAATGRRADGRAFPADISVGERFGAGAEQVVIVRDVTDRARAAAELARRAEALVRSNRELERFAYVASHDLQEPLRKIQAFGSLLDESARDRLDPEEQQALDYLIDAATRQRGLINDLLAYSRARTRPREVARVALDGVLAEVLDDLSSQIAERAAIIESDPLPAIDADRTQMRQLLQNLIGNALKYAHPERRPRITVRAGPRAEGAPGVRLEIGDNGIGFEPRFAERIFEPFRRLHARHEYPGSGVGLAICRQITDRHGGTISARGEPGAGAMFIVELPGSPRGGGADGDRDRAADAERAEPPGEARRHSAG